MKIETLELKKCKDCKKDLTSDRFGMLYMTNAFTGLSRSYPRTVCKTCYNAKTQAKRRIKTLLECA